MSADAELPGALGDRERSLAIRYGLVSAAVTNRQSLIVVAVAVAWLPLLLLSLIAGTATATRSPSPSSRTTRPTVAICWRCRSS